MELDMETGADGLAAILAQGGPAIWAIALLGALTAGLILWKLVRLALLGAWSRGRAERAVEAWLDGDRTAARAALGGARALRAGPVAAGFAALEDPALTGATRREEVSRVAMRGLNRARTGLRGLELIAAIAPLVGLLGTVLGMITAFQALESAGSSADPAALAGGIWEALLTTAAGMAVAIPASAALTWFESVADRAQADIEDLATRLLVRGDAPAGAAPRAAMRQVAE